jgi:hypothetical protein
LKDAKVLYDNSSKTADEVCKVVGVGIAVVFRPLGGFRKRRSPAIRKSLRNSIKPKNGSYLAIRGHVARSFWGRGGMILATI